MKRSKLIFVAIVCILGVFVLKIVYNAGAFSSYSPHFEGLTQIIEGPTGVEDITIDQATGEGFLSAIDRRNPKTAIGQIYQMQLEADSAQPSVMKIIGLAHDFKPHGLSLLKSGSKRFLFVVSHANQGDFIEKFEIKKDSLIHQKSFSDVSIVSPNDVVAVGENTFYFTNDHDKKDSFRRQMDDYLQIATGGIVYFDGQKGIPVSEKSIGYANGINVSNDGKYLYATSTTGRSLYIYSRKSDGNLTLLNKYDAKSGGLDNIEVDKSGVLWVGTHLNMLHFLSHAKDASKRSESAVLKMDIQSHEQPIILQEGVYVNNGDPISGVSVGAFYLSKKQEPIILIGSVFEPRIVIAKRKI